MVSVFRRVRISSGRISEGRYWHRPNVCHAGSQWRLSKTHVQFSVWNMQYSQNLMCWIMTKPTYLWSEYYVVCEGSVRWVLRLNSPSCNSCTCAWLMLPERSGIWRERYSVKAILDQRMREKLYLGNTIKMWEMMKSSRILVCVQNAMRKWNFVLGWILWYGLVDRRGGNVRVAVGREVPRTGFCPYEQNKIHPLGWLSCYRGEKLAEREKKRERWRENGRGWWWWWWETPQKRDMYPGLVS